ncbi:hypothetical protein [Pseudomonas sp. P9_31]|uniref:hypothetical protein n=1 Tax=Pseudomonas sp. P9_31 TaxID=3043448 RepID=UPI002A36D0F7|nr:hypothetical protein [Pseudomonas sp. P9_31]WPN57908.1 hypothetical protein QMK51_28045 [Pseudomonas sp. P9_31]
MKYKACENCYAHYDAKLNRCPDCNTSQGRLDDGIIVFTEATREEISNLGGIIWNIISIDSKQHILPCEWGVIYFHSETGRHWSYLCGIVDKVTVNQYIEVAHGGIKDFLEITSGKLIKRESGS